MIIVAGSLAAIALATLLPEPPVIVESHFCLVCGALGGVNGVLNVFLFAPLGVGLALWGVPGRRALLSMFALSVLIETAQLLLIPGRYSTLGDVLTNTVGGAFGFWIGRYADLWLRPPPRVARNLALGWALVWLAIQIVSNFGLALSLPDSQYYGQLARALPNRAVFHGVVLAASIGDAQIPNTVLAHSRDVRGLLLKGAPVATTVVPAELTRTLAPIVRVAGGRNEEIVLLAQNGAGLVFGVHTGAAVLRLRPPLFSLREAFASSSSPAVVDDTLRLSGRYFPDSVRMTANSESATRERAVPLSAALGWTFWLPFQWLIEGTSAELVISSLWTACLLIPLGYWSVKIGGSSGSQRVATQLVLALLGVAAVYLGLIVVPHGFGLATAPLRDWLATLTGILVGCALGARMSKLSGERAQPKGQP